MGSNQIDPHDILFLHGFWGLPSDWDFLKQNGFSKSYTALNYTASIDLGPQNFLSDWGQNFIHWKQQHCGQKKVNAVGYSQGGRLLLQALAAAPEEFNQVVLISSHPGLLDFPAKEQRLQTDRQWAKKFRSHDWDSLQKEWDSQGVFKANLSPNRSEKDFDREVLALCLENWSLAHQQNFRNLMNDQADKIRIILGSEDTKYVKLYSEFFKETSCLKMEKGAAHRVPFDQPSNLVKNLNLLFS